MSSDRLIRGIHIIPLRDFIHKTYDEGTKQRIYESFSPDTRDILQSVKPDDWHPIRVVAEMNRGIYTARNAPEQGYEDVVAAGAAVAEYGVNTFMRLLIKLMTPEMLAKKWPTIWQKSHNFGRMEADVEGERRLVLTLHDVEDYDYIGATAVGFLSYSLRAMGKHDAKVVERNKDLGRRNAPSYSFEITW